jgi:hypothetical protein
VEVKRILLFIVITLTLLSCRVNEFAVEENSRIYSCAPIGTIIVDSTMRAGFIVKITVIGKRGKYAYELIDKEGKVVKSGKYEKTHVVRGIGEKENSDGTPPTRYRARYYEPGKIK